MVVVAYGSFSLQSFNSQFKQGFKKVVVTRAGPLRVVAKKATTVFVFMNTLKTTMIHTGASHRMKWPL